MRLQALVQVINVRKDTAQRSGSLSDCKTRRGQYTAVSRAVARLVSLGELTQIEDGERFGLFLTVQPGTNEGKPVRDTTELSAHRVSETLE